MNNKQRGFSSLMSVLVLAGLVIVVGGYFLTQKDTSQEMNGEEIVHSETIIPTTEEVSMTSGTSSYENYNVESKCEIQGVGTIVQLTNKNDRSFMIGLQDLSGKVSVTYENKEYFRPLYEGFSCVHTGSNELVILTGYGDGGESNVHYLILSIPSLTLAEAIEIGASGGAYGHTIHIADSNTAYVAMTESKTILYTDEEGGDVTVGLFKLRDRNGSLSISCTSIEACRKDPAVETIEVLALSGGLWNTDWAYHHNRIIRLTLEAKDGTELFKKDFQL